MATSTIRDVSAQLNNTDFKFICQYVYDATGIVIGESKREMLYRRLARIIREKQLSSFGDYCQQLRQSPEGEKSYFINAITTNLTSFFRENHHFDYLLEHEIPALLKRNDSTKKIRIWSTATSTGEEPYSIAITVHRAMSNLLKAWDVKILATDIDSNVLATAKTGVYDVKRIEDIEPMYKTKYFQKGRDDNADKVKIEQKVQQLITFKQLNLLHQWPISGPFDVIFCRNVLIYFDKPTQQKLFERYYELLAPGGLLMLGHSENLGAYQQYFHNVGRTIFRKPIEEHAMGDVM